MSATRTCRRCGGSYPETFFRNVGHASNRLDISSRKHRSAVCLGCTQTSQDTKKAVDRLPIKARDTIRHHARVLVARGKVQSTSELVDRYGWSQFQLAHDIQHSYKNGCPYCQRPFSEMGHGLNDIQLDIVDPSKPPNYRTNTRWVCQTCNRMKSNTSPELWEERLYCFALHAKQTGRIAAGDVCSGLPLFEGYERQEVYGDEAEPN